MIVDFDVHPGNGTQDATEADPDILYLSTHQMGIYPGSGAIDDTGSGAGRGSGVNIPLPGGGGGPAFAPIAEPVIAPLAGIQLSIAGYYALGQALAAIAQAHCHGRIVYALEGGYDPEVLAEGIRAVALSLAGEPLTAVPLGPAPKPEPEVDAVLEQVRALHGL